MKATNLDHRPDIAGVPLEPFIFTITKAVVVFVLGQMISAKLQVKGPQKPAHFMAVRGKRTPIMVNAVALLHEMCKFV